MLVTMPAEREFRITARANVSYPDARRRLCADAAGLFHRATHARTDSGSLVALTATLAGVKVTKEVEVTVELHPDERPPLAPVLPATGVTIRWHVVTGSGLFPVLRAAIAAYPLEEGETQLDLHGIYVPPGGPIGAVGDSLFGHRIAEESLQRFLADVAAELSTPS